MNFPKILEPVQEPKLLVVGYLARKTCAFQCWIFFNIFNFRARPGDDATGHAGAGADDAGRTEVPSRRPGASYVPLLPDAHDAVHAQGTRSFSFNVLSLSSSNT